MSSSVHIVNNQHFTDCILKIPVRYEYAKLHPSEALDEYLGCLGLLLFTHDAVNKNLHACVFMGLRIHLPVKYLFQS